MKKRNLKVNEINRKIELNQVLLQYFVKSDKKIDLSEYKIPEEKKEEEKPKCVEDLLVPSRLEKVLKYSSVVYSIVSKFVESNRKYGRSNRVVIENENILKDVNEVHINRNTLQLKKSGELNQVWLFDFDEPTEVIRHFNNCGIRCLWFKCNENVDDLIKCAVNGSIDCCEYI